MKSDVPKSPEQIVRRKMQMTIKAKQAARHAELLRENAQRLKAEVKPLRKRYKQARKAARKAEKKAARLAEELQALLALAAQRSKEAPKRACTPRRRKRPTPTTRRKKRRHVRFR